MILVGDTTFPTLAAVHEWAWDTNPDKVAVLARGEHSEPPLRWTHPASLTIQGGTWHGENRKGWWLVYGPPRPSAALHLISVHVLGYQAGQVSAAVSVDGRTEPSGEKAWLAEVRIDGCRFKDTGGLGAVYLQGVRGFTVTDTIFKRIGPLPTAHAVYATDRSRGTVRRCEFKRVAGDPVRARDGSHVHVIACNNILSGRRAIASSWTKPGEDSSHVTVSGSILGSGYSGQDIRLVDHVRAARSPERRDIISQPA